MPNVLTALVALVAEHKRCGDLDAPVSWTAHGFALREIARVIVRATREERDGES